MIHTAKQLKDKVKNMSGGNSEVLSYNLETLLAEKMQTILARGPSAEMQVAIIYICRLL